MTEGVSSKGEKRDEKGAGGDMQLAVYLEIVITARDAQRLQRQPKVLGGRAAPPSLATTYFLSTAQPTNHSAHTRNPTMCALHSPSPLPLHRLLRTRDRRLFIFVRSAVARFRSLPPELAIGCVPTPGVGLAGHLMLIISLIDLTEAAGPTSPPLIYTERQLNGLEVKRRKVCLFDKLYNSMRDDGHIIPYSITNVYLETDEAQS